MTLLHCKCEGFILYMGFLNVYFFVLPYTGQFENIVTTSLCPYV